MLYYFEDGEIVITYPTEITDTDLISVNDSMVTGLREGTVKVSLKINDIVLTTNIKVEGAYSEALKENTPNVGSNIEEVRLYGNDEGIGGNHLSPPIKENVK